MFRSHLVLAGAVIEVDGKQPYAAGELAEPRLYSEMVSEDRRQRLRGYVVYRFGGHELMQPDTDDMLRTFFKDPAGYIRVIAGLA